VAGPCIGSGHQIFVVVELDDFRIELSEFIILIALFRRIMAA
jgi:hypothetical protein